MDYRMEIASRVAELTGLAAEELAGYIELSLIHISEPTRPY